ncbi:MAG: enolase C-terminal domain-like protein [Phycisphaerae bacterium]
MTNAVIRRLTLFPLSIPLRWRVTTARSSYRLTENIIVSAELADGTIGYGESVPRRDVSDETADSAAGAFEQVFGPALVDFHPSCFPEALEALEALPWQNRSGHRIPATRAAIEMGLLDAAMQSFDRNMDDVVQWMGLPGFGSPGSLDRVRFSGVLADEDDPLTRRRLRGFYWRGVRDFSLSVGMSGDLNRTRRVAAYLRRPLACQRATLTIDAEGWWSKDEAIEWLSDAEDLGITHVEQPLPRSDDQDLLVLRDLFELPVIADESVLSVDDVQRIVSSGAADGVNVGLSKCGGLLPSLRIAAAARRAELSVRLGCALGETSVLAAAGLRFLQVCPGVLQAEGCLGTSLLSDDVTARSLRFGYGGRPPKLGSTGLGPPHDPERIRSLCDGKPIVLVL